MTGDTVSGGWDLAVAPWHLGERIPDFPVPAGAAELTCPALPASSPLDGMRLVSEAVADAAARPGRPLLLAGDCCAALGAVAGLQRRHGQVSVVWLDAHGDFNTPATTVTGYLGGMPLAVLTGRAPELTSDRLGLRPVADGDVVLVDARDLDPAERDALAASRIRRLPADPAAMRAALGELGRPAVYLHVDVDVVDASLLPGLRVPAGPGPALSQVRDCLTAVIGDADVIGACIACTWRPERLNDQWVRAAISRLAAVLGARLAWHPDSHRWRHHLRSGGGQADA